MSRNANNSQDSEIWLFAPPVCVVTLKRKRQDEHDSFLEPGAVGGAPPLGTHAHLAMFALRHLAGAITTPPVCAASMIARRGALPANGLLGALAMPSAGSSWALWARSLATHTVTPPLNWRGRQPPPGYMPRAEPITEEHIGKTFLVHSGKEHKRVKVTAQMVMHKFGEFVLTRKRPKKAEKPVQQKKK